MTDVRHEFSTVPTEDEERARSFVLEDMRKRILKQSLREGWQVQTHPVRWLRGVDHA